MIMDAKNIVQSFGIQCSNVAKNIVQSFDIQCSNVAKHIVQSFDIQCSNVAKNIVQSFGIQCSNVAKNIVQSFDIQCSNVAKNIVQSFGIQCSNLGILMNFGVMGPQKNAKNKHSWQLNSCRADRHCPSWGTSRILLASCSWLESQLLHWSGYRHHFFGMTWKDSNRKLLKYHTQVVHPPKLVSPPMFRNSRK